MILCQKMVELKILFRPKNRYIRFGLAFIKPSTIELLSPAGLIAGASAIKTSTFSFSAGWILSVAKACAVPWEKPMYDRDG